MKHKVSELEGALLDAAVAKAEGCLAPPPPWWNAAERGEWQSIAVCAYSTDWRDGGPIIERELIFFSELPMHEGGPEVMVARCGRTEGRGRGHLIAAMRAYVASKFGAEVELP